LENSRKLWFFRNGIRKKKIGKSTGSAKIQGGKTLKIK
jgi:hypothetical protein